MRDDDDNQNWTTPSWSDIMKKGARGHVEYNNDDRNFGYSIPRSSRSSSSKRKSKQPKRSSSSARTSRKSQSKSADLELFPVKHFEPVEEKYWPISSKLNMKQLMFIIYQHLADRAHGDSITIPEHHTPTFYGTSHAPKFPENKINKKR